MDIKPRILAKTRDVFLPRGEVSYRILKKGRHLMEGGYQTYELEFSVDGKPMRKVPVRTYIKLYKDVVIAKDTIKEIMSSVKQTFSKSVVMSIACLPNM